MPRTTEQILAHADELAARFGGYQPQPGDEGNVPPLTALRLAAMKRAEVERQIAEYVAAARKAGVRWRDIGRELGTSGEAARQQYRKVA